MENRSNNGKNQTSSRSTNAVTNEHKHPNQYTKGAQDHRQQGRQGQQELPLSLSRARRPGDGTFFFP